MTHQLHIASESMQIKFLIAGRHFLLKTNVSSHQDHKTSYEHK